MWVKYSCTLLLGIKLVRRGRNTNFYISFLDILMSLQHSNRVSYKKNWRERLSETTLHLVYQMKTRRGPSTHGNKNVFQIPERSEIFTESKSI